MSLQEQLLVTAFDKGLLALLFTLVGIFAQQSLERLKGSLAWGSELLKQRLNFSLSLTQDIMIAEKLYLELVLQVATIGLGSDKTITELVEILTKLGQSCIEARLLFSKPTAAALMAIHEEINSHSNYEGWSWCPKYSAIKHNDSAPQIREQDEINTILQQEGNYIRNLKETLFQRLSNELQSSPKALFSNW